MFVRHASRRPGRCSCGSAVTPRHASMLPPPWLLLLAACCLLLAAAAVAAAALDFKIKCIAHGASHKTPRNMPACCRALTAIIVVISTCSALSQDITWIAAETPTDNRPLRREDAYLLHMSLNRLALIGGITGEWGEVGGRGTACGDGASLFLSGAQGCSNAVDLWSLSVDGNSKSFVWSSMTSNTGLPSNLTGASARPHIKHA